MWRGCCSRVRTGSLADYGIQRKGIAQSAALRSALWLRDHGMATCSNAESRCPCTSWADCKTTAVRRAMRSCECWTCTVQLDMLHLDPRGRAVCLPRRASRPSAPISKEAYHNTNPSILPRLLRQLATLIAVCHGQTTELQGRQKTQKEEADSRPRS